MKFQWTVLCGFVLSVLCGGEAPARELVLNAVGDIMLAGSAAASLERLGYDYPFAATCAELKKGDMAVGNLEAPIARHGIEFTDKRFRFRTDPRSAGALQRAGFSVLTLANNHMMDFGPSALRETIRHLDGSGILHTGAGETSAAARRPVFVRKKEGNVAFLAYSLTLPEEFYAAADHAGTAPGYAAQVREDIVRAKASADYVVVSFHWGSEGATIPHSYQVRAAHAAIDAGADVVLGHHPHVLQGIERYRKGIIFYSLGNFAFGSRSRTADRSVIARITLDKGVRGVELVPLNVKYSDVRFQPRPLSGQKGRDVIDRLNRISQQFGTVINDTADGFRIDMSRELETAAYGEVNGHVSPVRSN
jgi:poly-gamma-glutamate capsule biosynthesis protein CapA/YwtB (metallophosphatase superfamily)